MGGVSISRSEIMSGVSVCRHHGTGLIYPLIHFVVDLSPAGCDVCVGCLPSWVTIPYVISMFPFDSGYHCKSSCDTVHLERLIEEAERRLGGSDICKRGFL